MEGEWHSQRWRTTLEQEKTWRNQLNSCRSFQQQQQQQQQGYSSKRADQGCEQFCDSLLYHRSLCLHSTECNHGMVAAPRAHVIAQL